MPLFVDVILPLPLASYYTYSVPQEYEGCIAVGCRVIVPLGKSKHYTALVARVHNEPPQGYEVKTITELLDETAIVLPSQMRLWEWISKYYMCSLGEIYKAAVPQGLKGEFKPKTEQRVRLTAEYRSEKWINLLMQSLGARLAEAASEWLHCKVRRELWGYAPHENLTPKQMFAAEYEGVRPAVGYPSLPDQRTIFPLAQLLGVERIGISLTENGAMRPLSSVCGLYIASRKARYFVVEN